MTQGRATTLGGNKCTRPSYDSLEGTEKKREERFPKERCSFVRLSSQWSRRPVELGVLGSPNLLRFSERPCRRRHCPVGSLTGDYPCPRWDEDAEELLGPLLPSYVFFRSLAFSGLIPGAGETGRQKDFFLSLSLSLFVGGCGSLAAFSFLVSARFTLCLESFCSFTQWSRMIPRCARAALLLVRVSTSNSNPFRCFFLSLF